MLTCIMCICIPCQSGAVLLHVIMCVRACMHVADCVYREGVDITAAQCSLVSTVAIKFIVGSGRNRLEQLC